MIPFNKPYISGNELHYMEEAVKSGKISGDGIFTRKCSAFFELRFGFQKVLLTTSCTDALELAALLLDIKAGDEIIAPSYTFVSTVNAFVLRGATIVFADVLASHPNLDVSTIEGLITSKTKAIIPVHYAGVAVDMDALMELANHHNLYVIEDAAQAIASNYKGKPLGSIGHLAAFSFHETKNIISGEGGMLVINEPSLIKRAEIIREKGTNRSQFFRGEVDKYNWVDIGSSFLPSDLIAAYLFAQLENIDRIQTRRIAIWERYATQLQRVSGLIQLPVIPDFATNNGHMFYLVCKTEMQRDALIAHLKQEQIHAVFHYQSLHNSPYYAHKHDGRNLPQTTFFSNCLVRLPLFYELSDDAIDKICNSIAEFLMR